MVTAEMHDLVKPLIVKLRYTSDEAECVRMPTEVTFGDSAKRSAPVLLQQSLCDGSC